MRTGEAKPEPEPAPEAKAPAGAIAVKGAAADPFAGLSLKEAAAHTGLPARWLREQARAGNLRAENVGDKRERWMFPRQALS